MEKLPSLPKMQKSSWLAKQVLCTENGRTSKNHRVEYYFGIESFFLKMGILMARFGISWRKKFNFDDTYHVIIVPA